MSNNQVFLNKYRKLENLLKHRSISSHSSSSPVYNYVKELYSSPHEKDHLRGEKLDCIRELRNQMTHNNTDNILIVHEDAIAFLEQEILLLNNPINAYDICTKIEDVQYATLESNIENVIVSMIKNGYSHIPVLNKNKELIGVFSENTIFTIYNSDKDFFYKNKFMLDDIKEYLLIENHQTECFLIVSREALAKSIINKFQKRKINNKRLAVIFVTEDGNIDSRLLGMITPYDALIK